MSRNSCGGKINEVPVINAGSVFYIEREDIALRIGGAVFVFVNEDEERGKAFFMNAGIQQFLQAYPEAAAAEAKSHFGDKYSYGELKMVIRHVQQHRDDSR